MGGCRRATCPGLLGQEGFLEEKAHCDESSEAQTGDGRLRHVNPERSRKDSRQRGRIMGEE